MFSNCPSRFIHGFFNTHFTFILLTAKRPFIPTSHHYSAMPCSQTQPIYRDEQKLHIIETASHAFSREGIRNVTMDDIAHRLSISKRTLYQIFTDKESLLLECVAYHEEKERECLEQMVGEADNVLDMVLSVFARKMQRLDDIKPEFFTEIAKYPSVIDYIEKRQREDEDNAIEFLQKGVEQGFFREDINFSIVIRYITNGMNTIIRAGLIDEFSQREIFFNTAMVIIRGCATMKGIAEIDNFTRKFREMWQ